MSEQRIAVYAGSFDPFTNGHLDIVKQASKIFDKVLVFVANNSKKVRYTSTSGMMDALVDVFHSNNLTNVEIVYPLSPMTVIDMCHKYKAGYIVRGLRNTSDFMYEEDIAKINKKLDPDIKTVYLRAEDDAISSSMVRELMLYNKDVSTYVPSEVYKLLLLSSRM